MYRAISVTGMCTQLPNMLEALSKFGITFLNGYPLYYIISTNQPCGYISVKNKVVNLPIFIQQYTLIDSKRKLPKISKYTWTVPLSSKASHVQYVLFLTRAVIHKGKI